MPHTSGPVARATSPMSADVTGELVVDPEVGLPLVVPGELPLDPLATQLAHPAAPDLVVEQVDDRLARTARRRWARRTRRRPRPTPGSRCRSKATTGSSKAMYSIVLFIVDTSLSGFFGSGDRPDVGGGHHRADGLVRHAAGELDVVAEPELVAQRHEVVEAVAAAHQRERDVGAAELVARCDRRRGRRCRRRPAVPSRRCRRPGSGGRGAALVAAAAARSLSGSGPVRTTVTSSVALPPRLIAISR